MPAPVAAAASVYPLAILDCGGSSLRLTLQPTPPTASPVPPIHASPNAIARTRAPEKKVYIGSDIESQCTDFSGLTLRLPIERGLTTDWVAQKTIWDAEISKALDKLAKNVAGSSSGKLLEGWNIVITEAYFNLPELEVGLDTIWFEEYGVKGLWRASTAQLASFAPLQQLKDKQQQQQQQQADDSFEDGPTKQQTPLADTEDVSTESEVTDAQAGSPDRSSASPVKASARSSGRQKRPQQAATAAPAKSKSSRGPVLRMGPQRRPEASVIVDIGHSYTHVVPMILDEVAWWGVRRLETGGKMMTNMLKEMISFKQWDMMEEGWIIDHLKEKSLFVAASDHEEAYSGPSGWSRARLLGLGKRQVKAIEQEFVLPDYSDAKVSQDPTFRYGRIRRGPGAQSASHAKRAKLSKAQEDEKLLDRSDMAARQADDLFIADEQVLRNLQQAEHTVREEEAEQTDEDDDDDSDYQESASGSDNEKRPRKPVKVKSAPKPQQPVATGSATSKRKAPEEVEDEQVLTLTHERWQIPELLFNPQQIGLDALPLPALIQSAVLASTSNEAIQGLMFANVTVVGGLANICGMRRRIETDLRVLVPEDYLVRVRVPPMPSLAAMYGAALMPRRFLATKLVSREDWEKPGAGTAATTREEFRSWSSRIVQKEKGHWLAI